MKKVFGKIFPKNRSNNSNQNSNNNNNPIQRQPLNNTKNINKNGLRRSYNKSEIEKKLREKELEEQKKEDQLEDEIRDHLKCYICLGKVLKPKMCKYCKKICCSECIDHWLEDHSFCGICKHQVTSQDMISLPFLDHMSTFFINNIDNQKKKQKFEKPSFQKIGQTVISGKNNNNIKNNKMPQINYLNNAKINININNIDNNTNNDELMSDISEDGINQINDIDMEQNICQKHGERISFYCIQCDKYFCSQCLIVFGEEAKKHQNHFIVQAKKINDLGVTEAIKEYKKLGETKEKLKDIIGVINLTKRESLIKKYEIITMVDFIRQYNKIKMDEETQKYQTIINHLRQLKAKFESQKSALPNEINSISQNNMNKDVVINKLRELNNAVSPQLMTQILESSFQSKNFYIENFETNFITKKLNLSQNLNNGAEILKIPITIIPHYSSNFLITYNQNNFNLCFDVKTMDDIRSTNYPVFNVYIIFKSPGYGLEFVTMVNDYLERVKRKEDPVLMNKDNQINKVEIDKEKFLFLCDNENKINFKICVVTLSYK